MQKTPANWFKNTVPDIKKITYSIRLGNTGLDKIIRKGMESGITPLVKRLEKIYGITSAEFHQIHDGASVWITVDSIVDVESVEFWEEVERNINNYLRECNSPKILVGFNEDLHRTLQLDEIDFIKLDQNMQNFEIHLKGGEVRKFRGTKAIKFKKLIMEIR